VSTLTTQQKNALLNLLKQLFNQEAAKIIIPAAKPKPGYWFGGGKLAADQNGILWLSGRYRNAGDSRTGLEAGVRGTECAVFRSNDGGVNFFKVKSWTKAELSRGARQVISIEGSALHQRTDGAWEIFISSEKTVSYPEAVKAYQKPGTGVWSIDRMHGDSPESLDASSLSPVFTSPTSPEYLHIKDPLVFNHGTGDTILVFCSHPYCWTSDNTGYAQREDDKQDFQVKAWEMVPRGATWDVAVTRITSRLPIPAVGCFEEIEPGAIYLYDGAECMRAHPGSNQSLRRPMGYSCEEIGGAFFGWDRNFPGMERLSRLKPLLTSPWGTGSSRYGDCLTTNEGILAIWQQSQPDSSQPLVSHFLSMDRVLEILAGDS
jgi:hypothetical protein